ncbi:MAG: hypothetical protein N2544_08820 [Burkholderiales bacterium]|nr:hypothetical protein [Burkholderiales bacterium]
MNEHTGVDLPAATKSATALVAKLVRAAGDAFPALAEAAGGLDGKRLGESVVRFEAARAALPAPQRVDAAAFLARTAARALVYADARETPLAEYMQAAAPPLAVERRTFGARTLRPSVPLGDAAHAGADIVRLAEAMAARHELTRPAHDALAWIARRREIDLSRERFAIMGAAAEIAPTELLLAGGATVLFLDVNDAAAWAAAHGVSAGTLVSVKGGADLLRQPREIAATIAAFADGAPVHVGAFAYRGGGNREWRLAAAMNAIVRALDPKIVKSVGMAVSPTAPAQASEEDAAESLRRYARPSVADRVWRAIGVAPPALVVHGGAAFPRAVVAMQGSSYLAAQYLEKRLAAEVYATRGLAGDGAGPMRVSANVAGITRTASMDIPLFRAAFSGAEALGVASYAPRTTRALFGLIYLENLLNPASLAAPGGSEDERARRVHATQVHGGLYAFPYAIDPTMPRAALVGLARNPALIPAVLRSLAGRR